MDRKKEEQLDRNTYREQVIKTINNTDIDDKKKGQLLSALTNRFQIETEKKFEGQIFDKPKVKGPIKRR